MDLPDDYADYNGASHTPTNSDVPQGAINLIHAVSFLLSALFMLIIGTCTFSVVMAQ